jgi:serine/threonine protein kinase
VTDAPPILPRTCGDGTTPLSAAFVALVAQCLAKNPAQRPSTSALLASPFFRGARGPAYLAKTVLRALPPLAARQERRRLPSAHPTRHSVGSWDFLPGSPTATADGRWRSSIHSWASPRGSRTHSRAVSTDNVAEVDDAELDDAEVDDTPQITASPSATPLAEEVDPLDTPPMLATDPVIVGGAPTPPAALLPPPAMPELSSSPATSASSSLATPSSSPASATRPSVWQKLRRKSSIQRLSTSVPEAKPAGITKLLTRTLSRK